jgi:hypothetical protein
MCCTNLSTNGAYPEPVCRKQGDGIAETAGNEKPRGGEAENAAAAPADFKNLRRDQYTLPPEIGN